MKNSDSSLTGGCQCGAIRFRVEGTPGRSSICHCRMCQKAFGAFYAPLVNIGHARVVWTRGEPKRFRSSNAVSRGFCAQCGTPLTFEAPDGMAIATGAFDDPSVLPPTQQWGTEAKLPFCDSLSGLPGAETMADTGDAPYLKGLVNFQHPDHDTGQWPPEKPL